MDTSEKKSIYMENTRDCKEHVYNSQAMKEMQNWKKEIMARKFPFFPLYNKGVGSS